MPKGVPTHIDPYDPPANPKWPFRLKDGQMERWHRKLGYWVPLSGTRKSNGYYNVTWTPPGESRRFSYLHVVTWIMHNGPVPKGFEVDHIDGDPSHNTIDNLRLLTHQQNIQAARARLGNWSPTKLLPHQAELLLALPPGWRCLHPLAARWGLSKYSLGNLRLAAKLRNDPRYLKGL